MIGSLLKTSPAIAEQRNTSLKIRARIIQCGSLDGIAEACERQSACCHFLEFVDAEHTREDTVKIAAHSCPPNNTGDGPVYIGPACKETIE